MTDKTDIQLVDNQPENLQVLRKMLSKNGYRVRTSINGELALASVFESPPDLILLNIRMPGMDGYEICRHLKANERTRDIPVLFLSDLSGVEDKVKAFAAGGVDFITTPFQEEEVLAHVTTHLTLRDAQKQIRAQNVQLQEINQKLSREIAERKQAEEALQKDESRFRAVLENSRDLLYKFNLITSAYEYFSPSLEKLIGISVEDYMKGGFDLAVSLIHPQDRIKLQEHIDHLYERTIEDEMIPTLEYRFKHPQLGYRWFSDNRTVIYDENNIAIAIVGNCRDITERKQAEEEIHRRNRELALFNHVIAASAAGFELESTLKTVCRELALAFDVPHVVATLLNKDKTEATIVAEHLTEGRSMVQDHIILTVNNPAIQHLLVHKAPLCVDNAQSDPRLAPVHNLMRQRGIASLLMLPLIIEDEVVGSLNLNTIELHHFSTEQINLAWSVAEQVSVALARSKLNQEQRQLSAAIEQSTESMIITDADRIIVYVNPAFERVSGYSRLEAIGQNPNHLLDSGKQEVAFFQEMWATIANEQVWRGRIINKKKGGGFYTEDVIITPVRNEQGDIVNYVSVQRDVTRELKLEEQYHQAQKMEAIGQLAGGVAHDFNNILTAIIGYASLPLDLNLLPPEHPVRSDLQGIIKSANRAADLTRQLLTFARRQIVEPQTLNLNDLIFNLDKMLRRLISENIELITLAGPNLGQIEADPGQIEQVLVNLVINARDAMPDGGKLTIETANVTLGKDYADRHAEVNQGEYVMLAVSDTGLGMTKEVRARIFEPFFTTKDVGQGTGLGLATCFGIVKQSGGHLWVYSEVGRGTTFKVYLPYVEEAISLVPGRDQSPGLPRGTETILLVEDEAAVRSLAARILREQGYTILEASNGEKALRLVEVKPELEIQLLLTDVVMPLLGGQELVGQLNATRPHLKVLFMSGYTDNSIAHHGILDTGIAFLQKPFSPSALAHKVRKVLDG